MGTKARTTQSIVNTYPSWANVRNDEQSAGFQFINAIGNRLDDLRKQEEHIARNFFLPTAVVRDIDVYYSLKLPDDFEFSKEDNDDTEFLYTAPVVSGLVDTTTYNVSLSSNNDIETFWYSATPTRLSLGEVASGQHILTSGTLQLSPFAFISGGSGICHIPANVALKLDGATSCVGILDQGILRRGVVQVEGDTREGRHVVEEISFVHDGTIKTFHDFKTISPSGIRVYGIEPSGANLIATSALFNQEDYPIIYEGLDTTTASQPMPLFWALGTGENPATKTLDLKKYDVDELDLRLAGYTTKQVLLQQELLDSEGNTFTPRDVAPEPNTDDLWVVSSGTLHLYSATLPYPDLSVLKGKDYQASSIIIPEKYTYVLGDEVDLTFYWKKPTTGIVKHRVWVEKPDGNKYSLVGNVEGAYTTDDSSWTYGEPIGREIRPRETYTLDQRGDYIYSLEVYYTDDTSSIDRRVVSVASQEARVSLSLSSLGLNNIQGIDFDSENKLWVLDTNNIKYQINRHYDTMMIDYKKKIIYFREPYTKIRVF